MQIIPIDYEIFLRNKIKINQLLEFSYAVNFNISEENQREIISNKIYELGEYIKTNKAILLGAFTEDLLIGFIWIYNYKYYDENRVHINQLVIDANYRRKGVAKKLLSKAESIAVSLNASAIDLFVSESNNSALRLYENLEYIVERRYLNKPLGGLK